MSPQIILAAMLDEVATQIATGKFGDVSRCVLFVEGDVSNAVVTYPQEPRQDTIERLDRAKHWLKTDELVK